jgi:large subunit ribosomal protein L32e
VSAKAKKEIKELSDLPYYKAEFGAQFKAMKIETLDDLLEALTDEEKYDEIVDTLKGIGPKHADHWIEVIEESLGEEEAAEEALGEEKEAPAEKAEERVEIVEAEAEPQPKGAKKVKKKEEAPEEEKAEVVEAEVVEKGKYMPKLKPELDPSTKDALAKRAEIDARRPAFKRQEWFRFQRLGETWRKPKGIHSKMRRHYGYRPPIVSIGYRGPKQVRGYHPSGFEEVMVHTPAQLEGIDPKKQAVRVGGTVGYKKRLDIEKKADELGIRVLNRTG